MRLNFTDTLPPEVKTSKKFTLLNELLVFDSSISTIEFATKKYKQQLSFNINN